MRGKNKQSNAKAIPKVNMEQFNKDLQKIAYLLGECYIEIPKQMLIKIAYAMQHKENSQKFNNRGIDIAMVLCYIHDYLCQSNISTETIEKMFVDHQDNKEALIKLLISQDDETSTHAIKLFNKIHDSIAIQAGILSQAMHENAVPDGSSGVATVRPINNNKAVSKEKIKEILKLYILKIFEVLKQNKFEVDTTSRNNVDMILCTAKHFFLQHMCASKDQIVDIKSVLENISIARKIVTPFRDIFILNEFNRAVLVGLICAEDKKVSNAAAEIFQDAVSCIKKEAHPLQHNAMLDLCFNLLDNENNKIHNLKTKFIILNSIQKLATQFDDKDTSRIYFLTNDKMKKLPFLVSALCDKLNESYAGLIQSWVEDPKEKRPTILSILINLVDTLMVFDDLIETESGSIEFVEIQALELYSKVLIITNAIFDQINKSKNKSSSANRSYLIVAALENLCETCIEGFAKITQYKKVMPKIMEHIPVFIGVINAIKAVCSKIKRAESKDDMFEQITNINSNIGTYIKTNNANLSKKGKDSLTKINGCFFGECKVALMGIKPSNHASGQGLFASRGSFAPGHENAMPDAPIHQSDQEDQPGSDHDESSDSCSRP